MSDLIERQAALDLINDIDLINFTAKGVIRSRLRKLPSVQQEQIEMIKEIREWINSGNRGSADYFIVDKIEEILNRYE